MLRLKCQQEGRSINRDKVARHLIQNIVLLLLSLCWSGGNNWLGEKMKSWLLYVKSSEFNKLAKLGDAIAISKSETMNDSLTN